MNTNQLRRNLGRNSSFNGVYPRDIFVSTPLENGIHIVNTDISSSPGEHWFVVEIYGRNAFIFDSYGALSPIGSCRDVIRHIARHTSNINMNIPTLQSLDTNVCGDYCLLYAVARERGHSVTEILLRLLHFQTSHLRDHVVRNFISHNFNRTSPDTGYGFDRVHVFP